jgi:DNA-binding transcriptional LysR family regulator
VALTEAGDVLAARATPALQTIAEALDDVTSFGTAPAGRIRLSVSTATAAPFVREVLSNFLREYPDITLNLDVGQGRQQSTYDGVITKDRSQRTTMNILKLTEDQRTLLGCAPHYLIDRMPPRTPMDLHQHRCVRMRWLDIDLLIPWIFELNGERISLDPEPSLVVDDVEYLTSAVVEGAGLGRLAADFVAPLLQEGRLLSLLPEWSPFENGLSLLWDRSVPVRPPFNALLRYLRNARQPGKRGDTTNVVQAAPDLGARKFISQAI